MNKLPAARSTDIVVQTLGKEILIYDLNTHKAYNLNETLSTIYQACDGSTSFEALKQESNFTDDLIFLALDQLKADDLIENGDTFISPFSGMSRREAMRKVGLATIIALPLISTLVAPVAAMAQSAAACTGTRPAGQIITCANGSNDCGRNADAAVCQSCTTVFNSNPSNCTANGFAGSCDCT